jgi:hypothetical protein
MEMTLNGVVVGGVFLGESVQKTGLRLPNTPITLGTYTKHKAFTG